MLAMSGAVSPNRRSIELKLRRHIQTVDKEGRGGLLCARTVRNAHRGHIENDMSLSSSPFPAKIDRQKFGQATLNK
jgi:hypothetical protein